VGFIEGVRAVPLITILFFASIVFPLFFPRALTIDQLVRIAVCMALFFACYEAEVIRGGFQAISRGQYEAADSLGLSYWQKTSRIIVPQALRISIPGIMNYVILAFKNTTLVVVVGIFDVLTATNAALTDPPWRRFFTEAYIFVGAMFFVMCFTMSKYSHYLERRLAKGRQY
jgi:general L-amino acid transport system permease protein